MHFPAGALHDAIATLRGQIELGVFGYEVPLAQEEAFWRRSSSSVGRTSSLLMKWSASCTSGECFLICRHDTMAGHRYLWFHALR